MRFARPHPRSFFFALLLVAPACARPAAPAPDDFAWAGRETQLRLRHHLEFLEDPTAKLGIADVSSAAAADRFRPLAAGPGFGFTRSAYWVRFTLENPDAEAGAWLLEVEYPYTDRVDFFAPMPGPRGPAADGGWQRKSAGDRRPFAGRDWDYRNVVFESPLPQQGPATYYLRLESKDAMVVLLTAWGDVALRRKIQREVLLLGLYFGIVLALSLYNLLLFFSTGDNANLWFSLFLLVFGSFQFTVEGFSYQFLWPGDPLWANRFLPLSIGLIFFVGHYYGLASLNLAETAPGLKKIALVLNAVYAVFFAAVFFADYFYVIQFVVLMAVPNLVLAMAMILVPFLRGYRPARFALLAGPISLLSGTVYALKTLAIVPENFLTNYALYLSSVATLFLFALAVADRINLLRREREAAQSLAIETLEETDRMKDEFLAATSHELRTPLNGIMGLADALMENAGGDTEQIRRLSLIRYSARRLNGLVNDILLYQQLKENAVRPVLRPLGASEAVELALAVAEPLTYGKALRLRNETEAGLPPVLADPDRLHQILLNLIGNAIKFTETGEVRVGASSRADAVEFFVTDTGPGFPPEESERIFEAFVRKIDAPEGTGLGLAITRRLVEVQGGRLRAESDSDGARFYFTLPLAPAGAVPESADFAPPRHQAAPVLPGPGRSGAGEVVWVADDDSINLYLLRDQLVSAGYAPRTFDDGRSLLAALADTPEDEDLPGLVLLDVLMPGVNGYETCRRLRRRYDAHRLPVLLLTALGHSSAFSEGLNAGANDFIVKPYEPNQLLIRVEALLRVGRAEEDTRKKVQAVEEKFYRDLHDHLGSHLFDLKTSLEKLEPGLTVDAEIIGELEANMHRATALVRERLDWLQDEARLESDYLSGLQFLLLSRYENAGRRLTYDFSDECNAYLSRADQDRLRKILLAVFLEIATNDLKYGEEMTAWSFELTDEKLRVVVRARSRYVPVRHRTGRGTANIVRRLAQLNGQVLQELKNGDYRIELRVPFVA